MQDIYNTCGTCNKIISDYLLLLTLIVHGLELPSTENKCKINADLVHTAQWRQQQEEQDNMQCKISVRYKKNVPN